MRGGSGGVSFVGVDTADLDRRSAAGLPSLSLSLGDDGGGRAPGDLALAAAAEGEDGGGEDSGTTGGLEEDEVRRGSGGCGWDEWVMGEVGAGVRSRSLAVMGDIGAGLPLSGAGLARAAADDIRARLTATTGWTS